MWFNLTLSAIILLLHLCAQERTKAGWERLKESDKLGLDWQENVPAKKSETQTLSGKVEYLWLEKEQVRIRLSSEKFGQALILLERLEQQKIPSIGNEIQVTGEVWDFREASVPGQYDEKNYYEANGYSCRIQAGDWDLVDGSIYVIRQGLWTLKEKLRHVYGEVLPEKEAGVLTAMLLGDKSGMDAKLKESYRDSGISHLVAVSGLHVSLLGGAILFFLQRLPMRKRGPELTSEMVRNRRIQAGILAIILIISYGVLIDYPISTNRAVIMMVLYLFAGMAGRTYDLPTALSCALLCIVLKKPEAVGQAGFQLSFLAVAGISLLYPVLQDFLGKLSGGTWLSGLVTSVSVFIMLLPVQMYHFHEISLASLWNNLVVVPLLPVLLMTGIVGGMAGILPGVFGRILSRFLLGSPYIILRFYEWICDLGEKCSWAVWITGSPALWQIAAFYGLLAAGIWLAKRKWPKQKELSVQALPAIGMLLIGLAIFLVSMRFPKASITMLDVGQGDGIVIRSKAGHTFLMDGGSSSVSGVGSWRILPYLKQEGIRRIEGIFISHMDSDHLSGILELLEEDNISIECFLLPKVILQQESLQEENFRNLLELAAKQKVAVRYLSPGDFIRDGETTFYCLGPDLEQTYPDSNSASLILHLKMEGISMLLTGDMGEAQENQLAHTDELKVDILKVAHHGSKYSTCETLLDWCRPNVALISCGVYNRYGHPHEETLARLLEAGCVIYGTPVSGTIRIVPEKKKSGGYSLWYWHSANTIHTDESIHIISCFKRLGEKIVAQKVK